MTEPEIHLLSFQNYLRFAVSDPTMLRDYQATTGDSYAAPETPIDRLIEKATGADREFVRRFVDWAAGHYGRDFLPPDFLDRIVPPEDMAA